MMEYNVFSEQWAEEIEQWDMEELLDEGEIDDLLNTIYEQYEAGMVSFQDFLDFVDRACDRGYENCMLLSLILKQSRVEALQPLFERYLEETEGGSKETIERMNRCLCESIHRPDVMRAWYRYQGVDDSPWLTMAVNLGNENEWKLLPVVTKKLDAFDFHWKVFENELIVSENESDFVVIPLIEQELYGDVFFFVDKEDLKLLDRQPFERVYHLISCSHNNEMISF